VGDFRKLSYNPKLEEVKGRNLLILEENEDDDFMGSVYESLKDIELQISLSFQKCSVYDEELAKYEPTEDQIHECQTESTSAMTSSKSIVDVGLLSESKKRIDLKNPPKSSILKSMAESISM
jgi:hypothetical protein